MYIVQDNCVYLHASARECVSKENKSGESSTGCGSTESVKTLLVREVSFVGRIPEAATETSSFAGSERSSARKTSSSDERESDERESDERESDERESDERESDERESDERESDERESDERESDERESDERESDERESDERESDERESDERESDERESDERESDERRLEHSLILAPENNPVGFEITSQQRERREIKAVSGNS
ncbi:PREDICTED: pheromone-processing carboxypeptidase KEX1-like [Acropora digitifera]|uniref:pheromone-processing carboxypeptidase KEX1-like n=1 Tax=Acropora digitifera TaxID=70779 RepID=UPI00077ACE8F|nr:PREDICTED: pheromone-processing carboxypeptidase KEX1-like [Acropora digitifera]